MFRWMGLHFHDWIDFSGVEKSADLFKDFVLSDKQIKSFTCIDFLLFN